MTDSTKILVSLLFAVTYLGLALGRIPGLRTDRSGIAWIGAAALACGRFIALPDAAEAINFETIVLLLGMMIVVAYLRIAGFFAVAVRGIADRVTGPWSLLAVVTLLSGGLSAFLVNDVVCVALTPLVIELCTRLRRPKVPYLIALATASNVGSVATITGNPQNIIIGSLSQISYARFTERLGPVALVGLALNFLIVALVYRKSLSAPLPDQGAPAADAVPAATPAADRVLLVKSLVIAVVTVALFFAGVPPATVALGGAAVLLLGRVSPAKVYALVDWPLLVLFAGLFVVVHVFEVTIVRDWHVERWQLLLQSPVVLLSGLSLVLSNLVSNVPAVLLFKPLMAVMPRPELAWLALAMSSTLAGNLTLLGSVANLIVVERAARAGCKIGFVEYLKVGVPLTLLTIGLGIAWLSWT